MFKLRWNLKGRTSAGKSKAPPPEYLPFVKEKRKELFLLVLSSAAMAAAVVCTMAYAQGDDATKDVLMSSLYLVVGWIGFGVALT